MEVQEFFKLYDIGQCEPCKSCEHCALSNAALCGNFFSGCPLPPCFYFKEKKPRKSLSPTRNNFYLIMEDKLLPQVLTVIAIFAVFYRLIIIVYEVL